MQKLGKAALNTIFLALLVIVICQFFLPAFAEKAVRRVVGAAFPDVQVQNFSVSAFPAVKMLAGRADGAQLAVADFKFRDLNLSSVVVSAAGLSWDFRQIYTGFKELPRADDLEVTIGLREDDINRFLENWVINGLENPHLTLAQNKAVLAGRVKLLGRNLPVEVSGLFNIKAGEVWFEPNQVILLDQKLQADFSRQLAEGLAFKLPIEFSGEIMPDLLVMGDKKMEIHFMKKVDAASSGS